MSFLINKTFQERVIAGCNDPSVNGSHKKNLEQRKAGYLELKSIIDEYKKYSYSIMIAVPLVLVAIIYRIKNKRKYK